MARPADARRLDAAASAGFAHVECAYPYAEGVPALRRRSAELGVRWTMINAPAGDASRGERGLACRPDRGAAFETSIAAAIDAAIELGAARVTVMAGLVGHGEDRRKLQALAADRLRWAVREVANAGLHLQVEALNAIDAPGFLLGTTESACRMAEEVGGLDVQFDAYHATRAGEDVAAALSRARPHLGHVHVADLPDRSPPHGGGVPVDAVLALLDVHGYDGAVGLEHTNEGGDAAAFAWLARYDDRR